MLPGVTEFFSNTFNETLKRLLQPAGLIVASIFVVLNLLFIFPAVPQGTVLDISPVLNGRISVDDPWNIVAVVAVVLVLSYLLLSFSGSILRLMTGEALLGSRTLRPWLIRSQRSQLKLLEELSRRKSSSPRDTYEQDIVRFERDTTFPIDESYLAPTALGNVMNATAFYLVRRYGIDMTALWPRMESIISEKSALAERVNSEKTTLDFLVNLSFVLTVFATEHLLVYYYIKTDNPQVAWSFAILLSAYLVYRAAVTKARTWGDTIQLAFDLHREDLRKSLGLRESQDRDDERRAWRKVSRWLLWGLEGVPSKYLDDVFEARGTAQSTPGLSIECSPNAMVTYSRRSIRKEVLSDTDHRKAEKSYLSYFVLISSTLVAAEDTRGVYVLISDPEKPIIDRLPRLTNTAAWGDVSPEPEILPRERDPDVEDLLWNINSLPTGEARALRYEFLEGYLEVEASSNLSVTWPVRRPGTGRVAAEYEITIQRIGDKKEATIKVYDFRISPYKGVFGLVTTSERARYVAKLTPEIEEPKSPMNSVKGYCWKIEAWDVTGPITLLYRVAKTGGDIVPLRGARDAFGTHGEKHAPGTTILVVTSPGGTEMQWKCVSGVCIIDPRPAGGTKDTSELLKESKDLNLANWIVLELRRTDRAGKANACHLNNLGCAHICLDEWDAAEEAFLKALESSALERHDEALIAEAKKAARDNLSTLADLRSE